MATVIIVRPAMSRGADGARGGKTSSGESGLFLIRSGVGGKRGFLGRHQHHKLLLIIRVVKPLRGRREGGSCLICFIIRMLLASNANIWREERGAGLERKPYSTL